MNINYIFLYIFYAKILTEIKFYFSLFEAFFAIRLASNLIIFSILCSDSA